MKPKDSIELHKNYVATSDERQWLLYHFTEVKRKDGHTEKDWKLIGYYPTMVSMFHAIIEVETKGCKSLQEILKKIDELHEYFKSKLEVEL